MKPNPFVVVESGQLVIVVGDLWRCRSHKFRAVICVRVRVHTSIVLTRIIVIIKWPVSGSLARLTFAVLRDFFLLAKPLDLSRCLAQNATHTHTYTQDLTDTRARLLLCAREIKQITHVKQGARCFVWRKKQRPSATRARFYTKRLLKFAYPQADLRADATIHVKFKQLRRRDERLALSHLLGPLSRRANATNWL